MGSPALSLVDAALERATAIGVTKIVAVWSRGAANTQRWTALVQAGAHGTVVASARGWTQEDAIVAALALLGVDA